jgi:hypothetical protein
MYKKIMCNYHTNFLEEKNILIESYRIYKYGYRPHQLVYTGYIFTPKNELPIDYKKAFNGDIKEEFKKCIRKDTIFKYKLNGFEFKKCNIDWKVFLKASISLYDCYKNICVNKKYNLKLLSHDLPYYEESIWQIELNTSLDIDYINTTKIFAFAMGIVSKNSMLLLLDDDVLRLISSYIIKKIDN